MEAARGAPPKAARVRPPKHAQPSTASAEKVVLASRLPKKGAPPRAPDKPSTSGAKVDGAKAEHVRVRRLHRRDLNRVWEFIKLTFREVNKDTVEYQRPRTKQRFFEVYDEEGIEQILFETVLKGEIVGYAECAFEVVGADNWVNARYFEKRDMRPLYVDELAVHPRYQGQGVGSFVLEQLEHLARVRGCTHLVLEVAKNNQRALRFYHKRNFFELDAAIFLAKKVLSDAELLPPRVLKPARPAKPAPVPPVKPAKPAKPASAKTKPAPAKTKLAPAKP